MQTCILEGKLQPATCASQQRASNPNVKPGYSPYGAIKLSRMLELPTSSRHCVSPWTMIFSSRTGIWSLRWTTLRMRISFSISPPVMHSSRKVLTAVEEFLFTGNCNLLAPSYMLLRLFIPVTERWDISVTT